MNARTTIVVDATRLDAFVHRELPDASRRAVRDLIAGGAVRVNGRRAAKGDVLRPGDVVELPAWPALAPQPELAVEIRYLDEHLVVVDKPGGVRAHAIDPRQLGTIANWLVGRFPETAKSGDPYTGGLAHRLDTGTSGLLVAARTPEAFAGLRRAFRARAITKEYRAVVRGVVDAPLRLDVPLAHDPADRRRMIAADTARARQWPALTEVAPCGVDGDRSLVTITMRTGVTHQIRTHFAIAGHPIVGDHLYGGPLEPRLPSGRHALHAERLTLRHPVTGARLRLAAPWPDDLAALWPRDAD